MREVVEGCLHDVRGLHVVGGGVGIGGVVVVGVELDARDVFLEERDGDGAGKLLAPSPDEIEAVAEYGGEGVDVLVPGAVEVAEEEKIVVLELLFLADSAQVGKAARAE